MSSGTSNGSRSGGLRGYLDWSSTLGEFWGVPRALVLYRLLASRIVYGRSVADFDRLRATRRPVRQWREFVDKAELHRVQGRVAAPPARRYEEDKLLFARHCAAHDLPTPAPLAVLSQVRVDDPVAITEPAALAALFANRGDLDGFAKPLMGGQGYGTFPFTVRAGVLQPGPHFGSIEEFHRECTRGRFAAEGYLLQERLHPHPELCPIMPGPGLGTIRIKTFLRRDGSVAITMPVLKLPAPGASSDNLRTGSLLAAVNLESGLIENAVGKRDVGGGRMVTTEIERHPETGALLHAFQLPCWPETRALVERAVRAFPMLPALGWDVAIVRDGPVLVETNWMFAASFEEMLTGRGWRANFRKLYGDLAPSMPIA